ncbi:DNA primase [candidate division KSB3 bacterium]|uniref:DNA primase n=1 Tax=candidate division KSB3 bacterium TaxID=2044937 RepID=A0A2G6E8Q6_9BACT|nr:MAG: DNA primase [candidate division KSB3 bacterium]PIE30546.1 MAG: DNA primase [candidate division KSB3 bacterium]
MPSRIPEETIDEIRIQNDITGLISEYVVLEKAGRNFKGLCPFHHEKTPSFIVNPGKQIFHCYGCGEGGNVFSFLMKHEKYSFPEAVRVLAQRAGIPLQDQKPARQLERYEALYRVQREAAHSFSRNLLNHPQAASVREYLGRRGINEELIRNFSLGYALPEWDGLRKVLASQYPSDLMLESGLAIKKKNGNGQYDRFRDRLMIPIYDERGRIAGFGGRTLREGGPKYLNSPESMIFHKSRTLFGLHQAKDEIRRLGSILIVEGYFDMIIPYGHGVKNIAATMGTALTEQHLRLLQRYARKVVLIFDSDPAGVKAVMRTLDLFLASDVEVRAVVLPQGEDPDSFVRKKGADRFRKAVENAPMLLDFIRDRIVERYDLSRVEQQIECANQILPMMMKIRNIIERNAQISKTADVLHVTDVSILQQFKRMAESGTSRIEYPSRARASASMPILEQYLIKALLKDKRLILGVKDALKLEELSSPLSRKIVQELFVYSDKADFEAQIFDAFQTSEAREELSMLLIRSDEIVDPARTVRDCLLELHRKPLERATRHVSIRVREAQEKKDVKRLEELLEQKNKDLVRKQQNRPQKKKEL